MPELPQRVRLASLAPQLRPGGAQSKPPEARPVFRDPEVARRVMAAFHRGWREGTTGPGPLDPAGAPDEEGVQGR